MNKYLNLKSPILIIIFISLLTSNCAYHKIEKLKDMPDSSNEFSEALSDAYLEFALSEMNDMHDEIDAAYFAEKGIYAKNNNKVLPEEINNWDINKNFIKEATNKRNDVMQFINSKLIEDYPKMVAKTQLAFDCWLEQLEEGWQTNDIKKCYDNMNNNLLKLASINNKVITKKTTISSPQISLNETEQIKEVKEIKEIKDKDIKQKFEIYFAHDEYKLDLQIKKSLNDIIIKYVDKQDTIFEIVGHTDKSGTKEYNLILSKLRANAVKQYLLKKGLPVYNLSTFYYGETKPKIHTKDGVKEKQNRRVEIFINNNSKNLSQL